jgi:putative ABC transport system permease protein
MVPISYNLRNIAVRRTTTVATAGGVALVVFVFASVLMLGEGIRKTLVSAGSPDVAIVMRAGADAELGSSVLPAGASLATSQKEVARRPGGAPDATADLVVVVALDKIGTDGGVSNVLLRGVTQDAYAFHKDVQIVEGRAPAPGADEAIVGKAIRGRFVGLELGQSIELRKGRSVRVVGVFEAGGSSYESEVWGDLDTFRNAFGRGSLASSVRVRLTSPGAFESYRLAIEADRQQELKAQRETDFLEKQGQSSALLLQALGLVIAIFFSVGAMIGAMITMYAAVANRGREIATLRALGFSKFSILLSFLFESVVLALLGGAVGTVAALGMGFVRFSMINFSNWSEIVIRFSPTPGIIVRAIVFAGVLGVLGGMLPAVRAARLKLLDALRA